MKKPKPSQELQKTIEWNWRWKRTEQFVSFSFRFLCSHTSRIAFARSFAVCLFALSQVVPRTQCFFVSGSHTHKYNKYIHIKRHTHSLLLLYIFWFMCFFTNKFRTLLRMCTTKTHIYTAYTIQCLSLSLSHFHSTSIKTAKNLLIGIGANEAQLDKDQRAFYNCQDKALQLDSLKSTVKYETLWSIYVYKKLWSIYYLKTRILSLFEDSWTSSTGKKSDVLTNTTPKMMMMREKIRNMSMG